MDIKKKINYKKIKKFIPSIIGISTIVVSSAVVFGITASLTGKTEYISLQPYSDNDSIDYGYETPLKTEWHANNPKTNKPIQEVAEPKTEATKTDIIKTATVDNPDEFIKDVNNTYNYSAETIDGVTHQIMDKSFNEGAYLGLVNWVHQHEPKVNWSPENPDFKITMEDLDIENKGASTNFLSALANKPVSDDPNGFVSTFSAAIDKNIKTLILPGYVHAAPLSLFKEQKLNQYKKAGYILIDSDIYDANIASVIFRSDQAAFLSGIAACQYLQDNYDNIYSKVNDGNLAVGMFGGLPLPTVTIYMGGFEWGVWAYNNYILPKIAGYSSWSQETKEKRTIKVIKSGVSSSYFTGTFSIGDARSNVQQLLANGADVILPVAGPQANDAVSEIQNQHSPSIVIGVDTDQENGDLGLKTSTCPLNEGKKIIQFSSQKDIAYVTSMLLQTSIYGKRGYYTDENGVNKEVPYDGADLGDRGSSTIGTYGYLTVGNIDNNCVKLSKAGEPYLNTAISLLSGSTVATYKDSVYYLSTQKVYAHDSQELNKTFFDIIQDNMKFFY